MSIGLMIIFINRFAHHTAIKMSNIIEAAVETAVENGKKNQEKEKFSF
jgi:hypothetical protein